MGVGLIAVIDLGEVPAERVPDDPPARPRPRRRWTIAALTLATALSTAAADDPVPRPLPTVVLDVPGDVRVLVEGDRLFVVQPFALSQGRGDGRYVVAYHLMDLKRLWRVELPLGGDVYGLATVDGILALTGEPPVGAGNEAPGGAAGIDNPRGPDTVGLDPATGATLWRRKGSIEASSAGGRLILSADIGNPGAIPAHSGPDHALHAVTGTGELVWSYDPPAGALRSYRSGGEGVTLLAVVRPDGRVELRDTDTGELVRSGRIGPLALGGTAGRYVEIVGDLLLVRDGPEVLAYGLDRLDLRWRLPFEPGQDGWFTACGAAICVVRAGGGLKVIDPATGRVRWSDARWTQGFAFGSWLMATDFNPRNDQQAVVVVDPQTGRVVRELGRWHELVIVDDSVVALRFDAARALIARLDPPRGLRLVGVVRDVVGPSCSVRLRSLWCRRTDNTLGVWRLPG
jgi:outer membrane protein assembly factor BamB